MFRRLLALSTIGLLFGCGSTEPSPLAGIWSATSFTITESGKPTADVLAQGGGLTITVSSSNRTHGSLTIPSTITNGAAVVENMAGTATISGTTVEFQQDADTFVRDVTWTLAGSTLVTSSTISGVTLNITLTRQSFNE